MARNGWFGRRAAAALRAIREPPEQATVVFAHSYSAREVFSVREVARLDDGARPNRSGAGAFPHRAAALGEAHPEYGGAPEAPPPVYFDAWRDECRLADWIVVNSDWSA